MHMPPGHADDYEAGMASFSERDYRTALAHLEQIAEGASIKATLARFYVGQSHMRLGMERYLQGRFAAAAEHFRQAAAQNPAGGGLSRYLAACHAALGRNEAAAVELARLLDVHPEDVETRTRLALCCWKSGDSGRAERILRDGLAAMPEEPNLLYLLATLLASQEAYAPAIELLESCLRADAGHARAHVRLAQCSGAQGRAPEALAHLQTAQRIEPNDPDIALQLSVLTSGGQQAAAKPCVELASPRVLDLCDKHAVGRLADAIAADSEFVDAFLSLPTSSADEDVFRVVLEAVTTAAERHPDYADVHRQCSRVLARLGRLDEAVTTAERAVTLNPHYIAGLIQLAQLYQATDRNTDGIERLEQALAYGANYPDVHYLLGQMYQAEGRTDDARSAYTRALTLNGNFTAARDALSVLAA